MISFNREIKIIAEFAGTFVLVFLGTGAIVMNELTNGSISHFGVSLVFGLTVFAMIYIFGKISGAHINPAVSVGLWITGKLKSSHLNAYILAQMIGALTASLSIGFLFVSNENLGATLPSGSQMESFFIEVVLSFVLVQVILITDDNQGFRKHIAIIVGSLIFVEAYLAGPITGASMNPARSFGPALVSQNLNSLWIYILAPVLGATIAAVTHNFYAYNVKPVFNKIDT